MADSFHLQGSGVREKGSTSTSHRGHRGRKRKAEKPKNRGIGIHVLVLTSVLSVSSVVDKSAMRVCAEAHSSTTEHLRRAIRTRRSRSKNSLSRLRERVGVRACAATS